MNQTGRQTVVGLVSTLDGETDLATHRNPAMSMSAIWSVVGLFAIPWSAAALLLLTIGAQRPAGQHPARIS